MISVGNYRLMLGAGSGAGRWPQRIAGREMDTYHRWM